MKIDKAVQVLRKHNEWRKGAEIPQLDPHEIGDAIDTVCNFVESITE